MGAAHQSHPLNSQGVLVYRAAQAVSLNSAQPELGQVRPTHLPAPLVSPSSHHSHAYKWCQAAKQPGGSLCEAWHQLGWFTLAAGGFPSPRLLASAVPCLACAFYSIHPEAAFEHFASAAPREARLPAQGWHSAGTRSPEACPCCSPCPWPTWSPVQVYTSLSRTEDEEGEKRQSSVSMGRASIPFSAAALGDNMQASHPPTTGHQFFSHAHAFLVVPIVLFCSKQASSGLATL